jgi:two-component system LytT family sensor kinase
MNLRNWKLWAILLLAATLVGVMEAAQVYVTKNIEAELAGQAAGNWTWRMAMGSTMPSWYVLASLIPMAVFLSRRFGFASRRWRLALLVHIPASMAFSFVHIVGSALLTRAVLSDVVTMGLGANLIGQLGTYFTVNMLTYFAIVGGYHAYDYGRRYNERERATAQLALKTSRLEASLAVANLDSLRMQLNPHFLFNTLNAIAVLAMKGERQGVVRMLTLLSDLLRLSLDQRNQVVTLREELQFLDLYLQIEQVRFRDRLTLERDVEPEALDAEVPSLLLQPLAENAIKHGISRQTGPGTVRVEAHIVEGDTLELRVLDTGPGFSPVNTPRAHTERAGVGTANTRARLEQLYGQEQSVDFCNRPEGGACVTVRLPLRIVMGDLIAEPLRTATA